MKTNELQELLKQHTSEDGTVNFDEITKGINTHVDGIIARKQDTYLEEAKETATSEFIKSLNLKEVENADQFNAYIKTLNASTDETKEALLRVSSEYDKFKTNYSELENKYNTSHSQLTTYINQEKIRGKGISEDVDYHEFKINKLEGDSFDEKLETYLSNNPQLTNKEESKPNVIRTTNKRITPNPSEQLLGFEKRLMEINPTYRKNMGK